jgi:hypothetical protein
MSKSKAKWGIAVNAFFAAVLAFAPMSEFWKIVLCSVALIGITVCIVGYFMSEDDAPEQAGQNIEVVAPKQSGNIVTAGGDVHQNIYHGVAPSSSVPSDVLLGSQIEELKRLQEFVGGKSESELWELFDLHNITRFNIRRAKSALNPKALSLKDALEINAYFEGGKAILSAVYSKVTRTAGGIRPEPIPGKLGILNLSLKHVSNRQTLSRFQSSHQMPLAIRDAIKKLDEAVEENVQTLLDVINEKMVENPENIFREENGTSPLFGATSGAFLDKRVWLQPKQEEIIEQVRRYLKTG